ncbi:NeuD/PglB/VioB family sugar acetyltransferase [Polaribacter litorisediminis]|uniref:NeuD/PglB/VioB family sugar acetyltransferase n=1 Tax=Polaribacter litorisediminis TaxID=1908341 RepID=UPI001CBA8043|nr:NeuD/PglB/VioB family sugar acetyltransferase [Polaribacter litorisediminis]UAM96632.1 NeuD/PglB/VioB family sugar acetyltransferase [Polaribacter litorisediminis]
MLVIGAKGLAKEILQILEEKNYDANIFFFDDVNLDDENILFSKYKIIRTIEEVENLFKIDNSFILGLGNPNLRKMLYEKFSNLGGDSIGIRSKDVYEGKYTNIGDDAILMSGVKISNGVKIGRALLAYYNVIITHDVEIGDFVELSPGCVLLGEVKIEDNVQIGARAVILPKLIIGEGATIGAGAVVTRNVEPNTIVVGNPARKLVNSSKVN